MSVEWKRDFSWRFRAIVAGFYPALDHTASGLLWHNYLCAGDPTPGQPRTQAASDWHKPGPGVGRSHQLPAKTGCDKGSGHTYHTSSIFVIRSTSPMTPTERTLKITFLLLLFVACLQELFCFCSPWVRNQLLQFSPWIKCSSAVLSWATNTAGKCFLFLSQMWSCSTYTLQIKLHRTWVGSVISHLVYVTAPL